MPYLKPAQLHAEWKSKQYRPVYLFAGEETYFLDEAWQQLEKALALDSLNCETFFGTDFSVDTLILALQTLPFMADRRLLVVKDAHKIKSADSEKLAECLKNPVPSSCLVLLWPDKVKREAKNSDLFSAVDKVGAVVEFRAPYEKELPAWITQQSTLYGKCIREDAIQALIQESGSSLLDLHNELEKLSLFTGSEKEITVNDVELMSGHTRQANLNQLSEAVEARKTGEALQTVESLLEEGEIPLRILATIYRVSRRQLIAASLQHESRRSVQEIRQELYLHPYFDRNFFVNLSHCTLENLKKNIGLIMQADKELKSSTRPEQSIFEELIISMR